MLYVLFLRRLSLLTIFLTHMLSSYCLATANRDILLERLSALEVKLSEQESLKDEISELRAEVERLRADQNLVNDDIEIVKEDLEESLVEVDESVKKANSDLTIGGYVDVEFHHRKVRGQSAPSKFDQHRLVFDIQANISQKASFTAELEYEHAAGSVGLEQGYIDYLFSDEVGFRAGSILVPMGRVNYLHDSPLQELNERPLVTRLIVPTTWYDIGAGLFGQIGGGKKLSYEFYLMNGLQDDAGNLANASSFRGLRKKGKGGTEESNNKSAALRLSHSPMNGTNLGLAYYRTDVGAYSSAADPVLGGERYMQMWGIDIESSLSERLDFQGEYIWGDVDKNIASQVLPNEFAPNNSEFDFSGWYAQLNYALGDSSKYKAIYRLGKVDSAKNFQNGGDRTEQVLGLNYRPDSSTVYKIEYHWEDEMSSSTSGQKLNNNGFVLGVATYF